LLDVSFIRKQSGQIREKLPSCHSTLYGCHGVCCHGRLTFFSYYALYTYCRIFVCTVRRVATSATTDEKLEGSSRGLDTDPFLFLVRSSPSRVACSTRISLIPLFVPSPLELVASRSVSCPQCPANNDSELQRLEGAKYSWST